MRRLRDSIRQLLSRLVGLRNDPTVDTTDVQPAANSFSPPRTEGDWRLSTHPWSMLHVIREIGPSVRKVRLFNAAICRRYWKYLPAASQAILVESELLADGLVPKSSNEMELCWRANLVVAPLNQEYPLKQFPNAEVRIQRDAAAAVCYAVIPNDLFGAFGFFLDIDPAEKGPQSVIIRDIFVNPFRPVKIDPSWRTQRVVNLALEIYDSRAFDRLPVLADTLEEAGCRDADILTHCRGPGPHVRGCWALDLVLGKE
jgi:hypothetical protein